MNQPAKMSEAAKTQPGEPPVVQPAERDQGIGKAEVKSGTRGKPFSDLLARVEQKYPGIEDQVGLSSAAMRAGRWIREMRLAKGWTQVRLAQELGWEQERVSNLERGEGTRGPTFDVLQRVAAACDYELTFAPRAAAKRAAAGAAAPLSFADMLKLIGDGLVRAGVYGGGRQPRPSFAASCASFAEMFKDGAPAYATAEKEPENIAEIAEIGDIAEIAEIGDVPYVELSSRGKRMITVPVLIEKIARARGGAAAKLQVKLTYPHQGKKIG